MKRIFTLIVSVASCLSLIATTFNFSSSVESQTIDGITVTLAKGDGNNAPAVYSDNVRLYASNTITISGANLEKIMLSFTKQGTKDYASLTASTGSLASGGASSSNDDVKTDTWTGKASSVTFTLGSTGQRILKQIIVNGDGSETPSNPGEGDGDDNQGSTSLDPNYKYAEPTVVSVPDITVQGASYSFISNNIEVSCDKGAVTDSYFSAHAGFNMTFTAAKAIKGLVINGFVKKGFEATADHGEISFLSPSEDAEANPVVVIKDINSKTVTISCVKQLRCYSVEVYFEENPEATVAGGGASGSTRDLVFDSAECVYESEYSEIVGEENYSIFLFNAASPDLPYVALDLYPAEKDEITGTYTFDNGMLGDYTYYIWGEGDYDMAWALEAEVSIAKTGDNYTISGFMIGDNGVRYTFSFSGKMPIYLDSDYYYGDGEDGSDGIKDAVISKPALDPIAPMFTITGQKVDSDYRGIVIQNGHKFILR